MPSTDASHPKPTHALITRFLTLWPTFFASLLAAISAAAAAQESATQDSRMEPPRRDYSKGFIKFHELGLPSVSNATYVRLDLDSYLPNMNLDAMGQIRLTGNAWMLKEDKTNASIFVVGTCRTIEVHDRDALARERAARLTESNSSTNRPTRSPVNRFRPGTFDPADTRLGGKWKPADLKKDIASVTTQLKNLQKNSSRSYIFSYGNTAGNLLLNAIHWHNQGYTNEANEVAGLLFASVKDPRALVAQGVDVLASSRFAEIGDRFFATANWADYARDVNSLTARYADGWREAGAARKLLAAVRKRLATPTPPPLPGDGLSPTDQQLALDLAAATNLTHLSSYSYGRGGLDWLIPSPRKGAARPPESTNALTRILQRGVQSVPLLIAMLKDDTLVAVDIRGNHHSYSHAYMSDEEPEDSRVERAWASMRRPATRAEIATLILLPLLLAKPGDNAASFDDDESDGTNGAPDEWQARCKAWHARIKGKTAIDLARLYAAEGNAYQSRHAVLYLIQHGTDADLAAIEKRILESREHMQTSELAMTYISRRGPKGREFAEKYAAHLKTLKPSDFEGHEAEYSKQWTEGLLTQLRLRESTNSAQTIVQEIVTHTNRTADLSGYYGALARALARNTPGEALTLLLETAIKAEKPATALEFLQMAPMVKHLDRYAAMADPSMDMDMDDDAEGDDEADANEPPQKPALDIQPHVELWRKLLADTRKATQRGGYYSRGEPSRTIGTAAAWMIEHLYNQTNDEDLYTLSRTARNLGDRLHARILQRARARLDGTVIPPLPSPESVTPEQRAALAGKLMAAPDLKALRAVMAALSMDEQLAVEEDIPENEKLDTALIPLANAITKAQVRLANAEDSLRCQSLTNSSFSKATVETLIETARRSVTAGRQVICTLNRQPGLQGMALTLTDRTPKPNPSSPGVMSRMRLSRHGPARGGEIPSVSVSFNASDIYANAYWLVTNSAAQAAAPAQTSQPQDDDDLPLLAMAGRSSGPSAEQLEEFWKRIDEFIALKTGALSHVSLTINGTVPATAAPTTLGPDETGNGDDEPEADEDIDNMILMDDPF